MSEPAPSAPSEAEVRRPSRLRRFLRWPVMLLAVLALTVSLVVGTEVGIRVAVEQSMPLVNDLFEGDILIGKIEGTASDSLILHDVRLVDGAGRVAVRVERLTAQIELLALSEQQVHIKRAVLEGVDFTLYDGSGEIIIGRVFQMATKQEPQPRTGPGWQVSLDDVVIRDGAVRLAEGQTPLVTQLSAALDLDIQGGTLTWSRLAVHGALEPRQLPGVDLSRLSLSAGGRFGKEGLRLDDLVLQSPVASVSASVVGTPEADGMRLDARLDRVSLAMAALEPLTGFASGTTGTATLRGAASLGTDGRLFAALALQSPLGNGVLTASHPLRGGLTEAHVRLDALSLPAGSVLPEALRGRIETTVRASLGEPAAGLAADARLSTSLTWGGARCGPDPAHDCLLGAVESETPSTAPGAGSAGILAAAPPVSGSAALRASLRGGDAWVGGGVELFGTPELSLPAVSAELSASVAGLGGPNAVVQVSLVATGGTDEPGGAPLAAVGPIRLEGGARAWVRARLEGTNAVEAGVGVSVPALTHAAPAAPTVSAPDGRGAGALVRTRAAGIDVYAVLNGGLGPLFGRGAGGSPLEATVRANATQGEGAGVSASEVGALVDAVLVGRELTTTAAIQSGRITWGAPVARVWAEGVQWVGQAAVELGCADPVTGSGAPEVPSATPDLAAVRERGLLGCFPAVREGGFALAVRAAEAFGVAAGGLRVQLASGDGPGARVTGPVSLSRLSVGSAVGASPQRRPLVSVGSLDASLDVSHALPMTTLAAGLRGAETRSAVLAGFLASVELRARETRVLKDASALVDLPRLRVNAAAAADLKTPRATLVLDLDSPTIAGLPLTSLRLEVGWPRRRRATVSLSAESPRLGARFMADVRLPKRLLEGELGGLQVTFGELSLREGANVVTARPGGVVRLDASHRVAWDAWALAVTRRRSSLGGRVETSGLYGGGRLDADLKVAGLDLGAWAATAAELGFLAPQVAESVGGRLEARGSVRGSLAAPRLEVGLDLSDGRALGIEPLSVTAQLAARPGHGISLAPLLVAWGERRLRVSGQLPISLRLDGKRPKVDRDAPVSAEVALDAIDLAEVSRLLPPGEAGRVEASGTLALDANLSGTLAHPRGAAKLVVEGFQHCSRPLPAATSTPAAPPCKRSGLRPLALDLSLETTAEALAARLALRTGRSKAGSGGAPGRELLRLEGNTALHLVDAVLAGRPLLQTVLDATINGSLALGPMKLGDVLSAPPLGNPSLEASLVLAGTVRQAALTGKASVAGIQADEHVIDARLVLAQEPGMATVTGLVSAGATPLCDLELHVPGSLGGAALGKDLGTLLTDAGLELQLNLLPVEVRSLAKLAPDVVRSVEAVMGPTAQLEGQWGARGGPGGPVMEGQLRLASFREEPLEQSTEPEPERDPLAATLRSAGDPARITDALALTISVGPHDATARVRVEQTVERRVDGAVRRVLGDPIFIEAVADVGTSALFEGPMRPVMSLPVRGTLRTAGFDLGRLHTVAGALFGESPGALYADLTVGGTLGEPVLTGALRTRFDRLRFKPLGLEQPDTDLTLRLRGPRVELHPPLVLRQGAQSLSLQLAVDVLGRRPADWAIVGSLELASYPLVSRQDVSGLFSGALKFGGTAARPRVAGSLEINSLVVHPSTGGREARELGPPPDVEFVGRGGAPPHLADLDPGNASKVAELLELDVKVVVPRRAARVKNDAIDAWGQGNLEIMTSGKEFIVKGDVSIADGTVKVLGREFVLEPDSAVLFDGDLGIDPLLAIRARYGLQRVELGIANHTPSEEDHILLDVSGRASQPKLAFSSSPPLPEADLFALLTLGFRPNASVQDTAGGSKSDPNSGAGSSALVSTLMGVVSASASQLLQERLWFDVVKVDAGAQDLAKARITVGKRLLRDLVLSYHANFGANPDENKNEVRLQYEILRFLQLDSRYGDAGAGGADMLLFWRF